MTSLLGLLTVLALGLAGQQLVPPVRRIPTALLVRDGSASQKGAFAWWQRRRAPALVRRALPDLLDHVARAVRSGSSLRTALMQSTQAFDGPLGADLVRVGALLERGEPLPAALDRWMRWRPVPGLSLAVTALLIANDTGGSVAQAVDGVATTLREDLRIHSEVGALASQARASALLIGALPIVFGAASAATDPRTLHFLVGSPVGWACLGAAVALDLVAMLWMRRIVAAVVA